MRQFTFDDREAFLAKLRELVAAGVPARRIRVVMPVPVHEALAILKTPASPLKFFTFAGALAGFAAGWILTIYTANTWPVLITSGKPLVSLPPFLIIAFELTILFGALASLLGFLHLSRLPAPRDILVPEETGHRFAIVVEDQP